MRTVISETVILTNNPLPQRKPTDHKGLFGHVLVIGGDLGMGGAICLAAEAALRTGAGLVTAITHPEHVSSLLARCPEIMCYGISDTSNLNILLQPLLDKASVCVIGPGMGNSPWSYVLFHWLLTQTSLPVVLDAGALDWLIQSKKQALPQWVLTPHLGEAARLLGISMHEIQNARVKYIKAIQKRWGGVIVLKGAGTLICECTTTPIRLCNYQNAAMATAGMGDVLSGVIGGLIAQGCTPFHAASQGVLLHVQAAEMAFQAIAKSNKLMPRVLLAHELFPYLSI